MKYIESKEVTKKLILLCELQSFIDKLSLNCLILNITLKLNYYKKT